MMTLANLHPHAAPAHLCCYPAETTPDSHRPDDAAGRTGDGGSSRPHAAPDAPVARSRAPRGRTIIVGADGASWDVIHRLLAQGDLPNFRRAMNEGTYGPLASIPNMRSAAAWTSMFTGYNPGKHGIYEFYEFLPQTYSIKFIHGGYKKVPGFWQYLDEAGQSTGIINTPMTYPAEPVKKGYQIAGLDGPGKESPRFAHPDDFMTRLERKMGRAYVIEPGLTGAIARGNPQEAVDLLRDELESKRAAFRVMIEDPEFQVDCLLFVFRSLDAAQHGFWKWMDPSHPKHANCSKEEIAKFGRVIDDVYRFLDEVLGDAFARMTADDSLIVISDHGFGQKCPVSSQLNRWLEKAGYLAYEKKNQGGKAGVVAKAMRFVAANTDRKTKERLARMVPGLRNWVQSKALFAGVDWSKTRVYSDSQYPRLRINMKGREGQGIVEAKDARKLMEELRERLLDMRDSVTGERIVERVYFKDELYPGPHTGPAEDILVRWREDIVIHGVVMPDGSTLDPADELSIMPGEDPKVISGDHHLNGIFLAVGAPFKRNFEAADCRLLDLTPTILHTRGLPIPAPMDGEVMLQTLNPAWLATNPVETQGAEDDLIDPYAMQRNVKQAGRAAAGAGAGTAGVGAAVGAGAAATAGAAGGVGGTAATMSGDSSMSPAEDDAAYDEAEQKVLEERLRSLGYIE